MERNDGTSALTGFRKFAVHFAVKEGLRNKPGSMLKSGTEVLEGDRCWHAHGGIILLLVGLLSTLIHSVKVIHVVLQAVGLV